jgi:hypothetical protein
MCCWCRSTEPQRGLARGPEGDHRSLDRLNLTEREDGHGAPREVDGKDASFVKEVARRDPAMVRFGGPSAERDPNAQAGAIGASLLVRAEQVVDVSGETAAFVLDLDGDALGAGA